MLVTWLAHDSCHETDVLRCAGRPSVRPYVRDDPILMSSLSRQPLSGARPQNLINYSTVLD